RDGRGGVYALRVAVQERAYQDVQRRADIVELLVGENIVDQLAGHQVLVGEQLADDRLELAPRLRVGEIAQVSGVDLFAEAGGRDQGQRRDSPGARGGRRDHDGAAQRVVDQVCSFGVDRVEYAEDGAGQRAGRA